ncbi:MAG: transglutaminase domain-containing protein [Firmicutes bacterium]|nr:transglutaminase domain-containing protein [Bacillota bacterium]
MERIFKGLKELKIVKYDNPTIIGDYTRYNYSEYDDAKLKALREKYSLDNVVANGKTEFEKLVLLRKWVKNRWKYGFTGNPVPRSGNAIDVLEAAEKGATFACGVYASVFMQCCLSLGFPARLVSILRDKSDIPEPENSFFTGHCVTEVWSNDYRKWVVFDPTTDWHYEEKGVPLNSYEVRKAWLCGKEKNVEQVPATPEIKFSQDELESQLKGFYDATLKMFGKNHADNYISSKAQLIEMWKRFTINKSMHFYTYIIIHAADKSYMFSDKMAEALLLVNEYPIQRAWPKIQWVENPDDVYFTLNQTKIELTVEDCPENPDIKLIVKMSNTDPYFDHYIVKLDDNDWETRQEEFKWRLKEGSNTISACTVNKYGRSGIKSSIEVRLSYYI